MKYVFITVILLLGQLSFGQLHSVDQATEALKNKEYEKAIELYQHFLEQGQSSPELHYNIGLAYAETERIGYALWHFKWAEKLGLKSEALDHNINLVRERRVDDIEIIPEFFLQKWLDRWKGLFQGNTWASIAMILLLGAVYGLVQWQSADERSRRKQGFIFGMLGLGLSMATLWTSWDLAREKNNPRSGILIAEMTELMAAPDTASATLLDIHDGIDFKIKDVIGSWSKIRLPNGQEGWILSSEIGYF